MMASSLFEERLKLCIEKDKYIIRKLKELIAEAESLHTTCNIVKTGGTAVGAIGTGIMVGSLLAAPFTGGASLLLTVSAGACSVSGAATNIITNAVDKSKTKSIIAEVRERVTDRETIISRFQEQTSHYERLVKSLVANGLNDQDAMHMVLHAIANSPIDLGETVRNTNAIRHMVDISAALQFAARANAAHFVGGFGGITRLPSLLTTHALIANPMLLVFFSTLNKMKDVGIAGSDVIKIGKAGSDAMKVGQAIKVGSQALEAGQVTSNVARSVSAVAVVATAACVVFTIVDVAFLISDWSSDHPTIAVINNVIDQLNEELQRFENLNETIDKFKEKAYLSAIDHTPIVSSSHVFINALLALLDNDVNACKRIFEENGIDWPLTGIYNERQLAVFIVENKISCDFDEQEVERILKTRGKKAKKAILKHVTEVRTELQRQKASAATDGRRRQRHRRGEHVINNSVLSLHRDIIEQFLHHQFNKTFEQVTQRVGRDSQIYNDYHRPVSDDIKRNIREVMIAHFSDDELYFDANALVYGILVFLLRRSARLHMTDLYNNSRAGGTQHSSKVRTSIGFLNYFEAYVDIMAREQWLGRQGGDRTTYDRSRLAVQEMFQQLYEKLREWVLELKRAGF